MGNLNPVNQHIHIVTRHKTEQKTWKKILFQNWKKSFCKGFIIAAGFSWKGK